MQQECIILNDILRNREEDFFQSTIETFRQKRKDFFDTNPIENFFMANKIPAYACVSRDLI